MFFGKTYIELYKTEQNCQPPSCLLCAHTTHPICNQIHTFPQPTRIRHPPNTCAHVGVDAEHFENTDCRSRRDFLCVVAVDEVWQKRRRPHYQLMNLVGRSTSVAFTAGCSVEHGLRTFFLLRKAVHQAKIEYTTSLLSPWIVRSRRRITFITRTLHSGGGIIRGK